VHIFFFLHFDQFVSTKCTYSGSFGTKGSIITVLKISGGIVVITAKTPFIDKIRKDSMIYKSTSLAPDSMIFSFVSTCPPPLAMMMMFT
jgi:hypothetical protein